MNARRLADAPTILDHEGIRGRELRPGTNPGLVHLALDPGAVIAPHTQPFAACFYILEGSGTVSIADAEIPVVAGELIEAAANLPRGIRNSGTGPLSLLVIKTTAVT